MSKETIFSINKILTSLPKKIIHHRNHDALATCVLYEISQDICLHLQAAAYFIYNPDFHLCRGITGINKNVINTWCNDPWSNISEFQTTIQNTNFNKQIKQTQFCTVFSNNNIETILEEIKKTINLSNHKFFHWPLPNNNIGILVYEENMTKNVLIEEEYIENAANLLGFCPIC